MTTDNMTYPEYKQPLDYAKLATDVRAYWDANGIFEKSVSSREGQPTFVFYEGPPSANGQPGIHHVMARAVKDIFCRYQTLLGKQVPRKGGWDTHGLPIELQVEKELGITKEDIGHKISVEDYNQRCRETVMRFKAQWDELTQQMGYWVDLDDPYITFEPEYIESCWALLKKLYDKGFLYKGYTIQPYSPAAGTGLSSHELNQPGTYKDVKDTTIVAQFKVVRDAVSEKLFASGGEGNTYILAWTTTPWTLPANTGLAVGKNIPYVLVSTFNPYTAVPIRVVLAKALVSKYFSEKGASASFEGYAEGDKKVLPWRVEAEFIGADLVGIHYERLFSTDNGFPHFEGEKNAFRVIPGDFVTTEDGTGIVHISPTFGADDFRVAQLNGIPSLMVRDAETKQLSPIVDRRGRYVPEMGEFGGRWVKNYDDHDQSGADYKTLDESIAIKMRREGTAFKTERYEHTYPHCWRTDKPVLYYPLDSWFIKTTAVKDRLIELNKTINWKPESTGAGRFGNWLENLVDWNLSRSRYWGTPLPVWRMPSWMEFDNYQEKKLLREICVGSIKELFTPSHKYSSFSRVKPYLFVAHDVNGNRVPANERTLSPVGLGLSGAYLPSETGNDDEAYSWISALILNWERGYSEEPYLKPLEWHEVTDLHKPFVDYIVFVQDLIPEHTIKSSWEDKFYEEDGEEPKSYADTSDEVANFADELSKYFDLPRQSFKFYKNIRQSLLVREPDLIDVWFDSGAMPYAQWHYPFENQEVFAKNFPADFIAEGVDQTRGWFFTLHALAVMLEDSVAFKNVIANGLVLDKNGNKMSKRLGNAVDPFATIAQFGPDATRWYMIANASPWDNLKFDQAGIVEAQRKFFGTLYNTYSFFALYANLDGFQQGSTPSVPVAERTELDRWILSKLQSLLAEVRGHFDSYDPTKAARAIQDFVTDQLSNWYVRLSRRRFWKGELTNDKQAAYETLHECLSTVAQLMAPVAPFFADWLYGNLTKGQNAAQSVHLTYLAEADTSLIDKALEERMELAQRISSLTHSLRKKSVLKVRQPLQRILVPVLNDSTKEQVGKVEDLICAEVNVKHVEFLDDTSGVLVKSVKPNFKRLGQVYGPRLKAVGARIQTLTSDELSQLEKQGELAVEVEGETLTLHLDEVEIRTQDLPGWLVATDGPLTVALDVTLTEELRQEGLARELVNRLQNLRKDSGLEVQDRIQVTLADSAPAELQAAVQNFGGYIREEVQALRLDFVPEVAGGAVLEFDDFSVPAKVDVVTA